MILAASLTEGSTCLAWLELLHTGVVYSVAELLRAMADKRNTYGFAPDEVLVNFRRMLLRMLTFGFVAEQCGL